MPIWPRWTPKRLRALQAKYGESNPVFARRIGVEDSTYRKWLYGSRVGHVAVRLLAYMEQDINAGVRRPLPPPLPVKSEKEGVPA